MNLNLFDLLQTHNYHVNAAETLRKLLEANGILTEEFPGTVLTPADLFAAPDAKWHQMADYLDRMQNAHETLCSTPPDAKKALAYIKPKGGTLAEIFRDDPSQPDVVLEQGDASC